MAFRRPVGRKGIEAGVRSRIIALPFDIKLDRHESIHLCLTYTNIHKHIYLCIIISIFKYIDLSVSNDIIPGSIERCAVKHLALQTMMKLKRTRRTEQSP